VRKSPPSPEAARRVGVRRTPVRRAGIALAVALAGGACVHPGPSSVKTRGFDADLVFGVKEPEKAANPANVPGSGAAILTGGQLSGYAALPPQDFGSGLTKRAAPAPSAREAPCPDAALNAFPAEQATATVPQGRRPKVGSYRWKRNGSEQTEQTGGLKIDIHGFEQRLVRNIKEDGKSTNTAGTPGSSSSPGDIFQFETVQRDINDLVVVTLWQVDSSPASASQYTGNGVPDVRAGGPERGIVIKGIDTYDTKGNVVASFHPSSGLLLLPLDVRQGEHFESVAIDSGKGDQTYQFSGEVKPRYRVDACGTIIDSWLVSGSMSISNAKGTTAYNYDVSFATQLGGVPVYEHIVQTDPATNKPAIDLTDSVGQVDPDPLPS